MLICVLYFCARNYFRVREDFLVAFTGVAALFFFAMAAFGFFATFAVTFVVVVFVVLFAKHSLGDRVCVDIKLNFIIASRGGRCR